MFECLLYAGVETSGSTGPSSVVSFENMITDIDTASSEVAGLESYADEIEKLQTLARAMESYGLSAGMVAMLDLKTLKTCTAIGMPSLEQLSMSGALESYDPAATQSMEGIVDTVKEKLADWGKKAMGMLTGLKEKVVNLASGIWEKIKAGTAWIKEKIANGVENTKAFVKAHPYAAAAAGVAAIAGIGLVIASIWGPGLPAIMANGPQKWINSVKAAFAKAFQKGANIVDFNEAGDIQTRLQPTGYVRRAAADALGWTGKKITGMWDTLTGLFKDGGAVRSAFSKLAGYIGNWSKALFSRGGVGAAGPMPEGKAWSAARCVGKALSWTWAYIKNAFGWAKDLITGLPGMVKAMFAGAKAGAKAAGAAKTAVAAA